MYKGVLFDLDQVLIDYEPVLVKVTLQLLSHFGIKLSKEEYLKNHYAAIAGKTTLQLYSYFKKTFDLKATEEEFMKVRHRLRDASLNEIKPMKHAKEIIEWLKKNKIKIALATSSDLNKVNYLRKKFDFLNHFDAYVTMESIQHSKPHPEIFIKAAELLRLSNRDALVVEDSLNGMKAAQKGGFDCAILKNPFIKKEDYLPKPTYFINDLLDIKKIIMGNYSK